MLNNPWILGGGSMTQGGNQIDGLGGSGHVVVQTQSVSIASSDGSLIHQTNTYESWVTVTGPQQMNLDLVSSASQAPSLYNPLDMGATPTMTSRAPDTFLAVSALTDSVSAAPTSVAVSVHAPFGAPNHVEPIVALPMSVSEPPLVATVQNPGETFIAVPVPGACDPLVAMPAVPNLYNSIVTNSESSVPMVHTSIPQTTHANMPSWYLVVQDTPDTIQNMSGSIEPPSVVKTDDDLFLCIRCNSTFEKASCINWHLRECKGDKLRASVTSINDSPTAAVEVKTLPCSLCGRLFTVLHETSTTFICSDCNAHSVPVTFPFGSQSLKQFGCSDCGDTFQFESELEDHQLSHRSSVTICELPDNYTEENGNEDDNLSVMAEPTVESPEENNTSGSYASDSSDEVEPEESCSENCGECGGIFSCRESLDEHLKLHEDIRSYGCTKCGIICVGKYSLNRHVWAHTREAEEKDHMVDSCFEEQEEDTKDEVISQPFGCTECGMQFSDSNDLKEHCVSHLRSKPFLCTQCGEKFETTSSLERHWEAHASMME